MKGIAARYPPVLSRVFEKEVEAMTLVRVMLLMVMLGYGQASLGAAAPDVELARKWAGTYTDHGLTDTDYFHVELTDVVVVDELVTARGSAVYFDGDWTTNLTVEWIVDTETLFIEIRDSNPEGDDDNYVASGVYEGSISRKLDKVIAIWRDANVSGTGTLLLKAVDEFPTR